MDYAKMQKKYQSQGQDAAKLSNDRTQELVLRV